MSKVLNFINPDELFMQCILIALNQFLHVGFLISQSHFGSNHVWSDSKIVGIIIHIGDLVIMNSYPLLSGIHRDVYTCTLAACELLLLPFVSHLELKRDKW